MFGRREKKTRSELLSVVPYWSIQMAICLIRVIGNLEGIEKDDFLTLEMHYRQTFSKFKICSQKEILMRSNWTIFINNWSQLFKVANIQEIELLLQLCIIKSQIKMISNFFNLTNIIPLSISLFNKTLQDQIMF